MRTFLVTFLFFQAACFGKEEFTVCGWQEDIRVKGLLQLEETINWKIPLSSRSYLLEEGVRPKIWDVALDSLKKFEDQHGYFSSHPLVGMVSNNPLDLNILQDLFISLSQSVDPFFAQIAIEELLTKVLAYRDLEKGMEIFIPSFKKNKAIFVRYEVVDVLNLWQGMPAFALVAEDMEADNILLFRGTDFSLISKKSWASILSDFDISGPGFSTFFSAREKINALLVQMKSGHKKVRAMGYSLGGAFAIYTAVFYPEHIQKCIAFNAPGVSEAVLERWRENKEASEMNFYTTQGDFVSKIESLIPKAFELSDRKAMGVIRAHTKLMCASAPLFLFPIDVEKENSSRKKS